MSAATRRRPYRSGFCSPSADPDSHARCRGTFGTVACACEHHAAPVVPAQPPAPAVESAPRVVVDLADELANVRDLLRMRSGALGRLAVQLSEVRALHTGTPMDSVLGDRWCATCSTTYPCKTARAAGVTFGQASIIDALRASPKAELATT